MRRVRIAVLASLSVLATSPALAQAGTWDIELETEVMAIPGIPANTFGEPREGLSLSTVLPEQLGLKLESERGPVDVLVIDSVEPPTPN